MGDIFLKINNPTENSKEQESAVLETENTEARLFKLSDVLKAHHPLYNKFGLVVDYTIKRKMMHKVIFN